MTGKQFCILTGCDSGIGKSLAGLLNLKGIIVLAGYLNPPESSPQQGIIPCALDLCSTDSIRYFTDHAIRLAGKYSLKSLIHCAGIAAISPAENCTSRMFREVFSVNLFGMAEINRLLIPVCLENHAGIYITTSTAAKIAMPYFSLYSASKAAAESYANSLRRELSRSGIPVVILAPRNVATPIWNSTWKKAESGLLAEIRESYRKSIESGAKRMIDSGNHGISPENAARQIFKIINKKKPGRRYIIARNRFAVRIMQLIPENIQDLILDKIFNSI